MDIQERKPKWNQTKQPPRDSLVFRVSWNQWRENRAKILKWDAHITFFSSIEGESQAHLIHMSTVKQFRLSYACSSPETMIYENVLTWKKKLIKNKKFINEEVEEFSEVTHDLPVKSSFLRFSLWVIVPLCQLSVTETNVPACSATCLFSPTTCSGNQSENKVNLLRMSIKLGQKCNSSGKKKSKIRQQSKSPRHWSTLCYEQTIHYTISRESKLTNC